MVTVGLQVIYCCGIDMFAEMPGSSTVTDIEQDSGNKIKETVRGFHRPWMYQVICVWSTKKAPLSMTFRTERDAATWMNTGGVHSDWIEVVKCRKTAQLIVVIEPLLAAAPRLATATYSILVPCFVIQLLLLHSISTSLSNIRIWSFTALYTLW